MLRISMFLSLDYDCLVFNDISFSLFFIFLTFFFMSYSSPASPFFSSSTYMTYMKYFISFHLCRNTPHNFSTALGLPYTSALSLTAHLMPSVSHFLTKLKLFPTPDFAYFVLLTWTPSSACFDILAELFKFKVTMADSLVMFLLPLI